MSAMEITDFGMFHVKPPAPGYLVLEFENELGQDWYEMRFALTEWEPATGAYLNAVYGAWAMCDADGVVTNVEYDPSRLMPGDRRILGIDADPAEILVGMTYKDGELT